jgi:hypothetical protein
MARALTIRSISFFSKLFGVRKEKRREDTDVPAAEVFHEEMVSFSIVERSGHTIMDALQFRTAGLRTNNVSKRSTSYEGRIKCDSGRRRSRSGIQGEAGLKRMEGTLRLRGLELGKVKLFLWWARLLLHGCMAGILVGEVLGTIRGIRVNRNREGSIVNLI